MSKRGAVGSVRDAMLEVNVRDPAAPRQIIYGLRRVSGVFYPVAVSGTNNEYLHVLLLIAGHEVQEIGDIYFNDELVELTGTQGIELLMWVAARGVLDDTPVRQHHAHYHVPISNTATGLLVLEPA